MKYENDEFLDEFYATVEPVIIANCLDCRDETELLDGIICWTCSLERSEMRFFDLFEIERWLTLSQKMESKPQLRTRSGYLQEKTFLVLVQRLSVKLFATLGNLKDYSRQ